MEISCETDFDCADSYYCPIATHKCTFYTKSEKTCYRSSECENDNRVCGNPGATQMQNCGRCKNASYDALNLKSCKCGDASFCYMCDFSGLQCQSCIEGYTLISGHCIKNCASSGITTDMCSCDGKLCDSNDSCDISSKQCIGDIANHCLLESDVFYVENCASCMDDKATCAKCNFGYKLNNNTCEITDTCITGKTVVEHCSQCQESSVALCKTCITGYQLKGQKCIINSNNEVRLIAISCVSAVIITALAFLLIIFINKKKTEKQLRFIGSIDTRLSNLSTSSKNLNWDNREKKLRERLTDMGKHDVRPINLVI